MEDKIFLIIIALGVVVYSSVLFYLNSKVKLNKEGFYKEPDENQSDTYDLMRTSSSSIGFGIILLVIMSMMLFWGFVLFDPDFLPK